MLTTYVPSAVMSTSAPFCGTWPPCQLAGSLHSPLAPFQMYRFITVTGTSGLSMPKADAAIVDDPVLTAVASPAAETVTIAAFDDRHVTGTPVTIPPSASWTVARRVAVSPSGDRRMEVRSTVTDAGPAYVSPTLTGGPSGATAVASPPYTRIPDES